MSVHELRLSNHLANAESDEDQEPQCWKDLKAETGFSSYHSYLEALNKTGPQFSHLLEDLRRGSRFQSQHYFGEILLLDILKDGSTSISLEVQKSAESATHFESVREVSTRLLQNLQSPPENVPVRILLWSTPGWLDRSIVNALGLVLDVHPFFFESLSISRSPILIPQRPCRSDHFIIGDTVVTIARKYRPEGRAPPVLLIAGKSSLHTRRDNDRHDHQENALFDLISEEMVESPSHYRGAINRRSPENPASVSSNYVKLLRKQAVMACGLTLDEGALLLNSILPLFYLEILRLRIHCEDMRSTLLEIRLRPDGKLAEVSDRAENNGFWLRKRLEDLDESKTHFIKFVGLQDRVEWLNSKTWSSLEEEIKEAIAEARIRDTEFRDCMQIQMGNLSIRESRRSIELSNEQFDEAKRGKTCKPLYRITRC